MAAERDEDAGNDPRCEVFSRRAASPLVRHHLAYPRQVVGGVDVEVLEYGNQVYVLLDGLRAVRVLGVDNQVAAVPLLYPYVATQRVGRAEAYGEPAARENGVAALAADPAAGGRRARAWPPRCRARA